MNTQDTAMSAELDHLSDEALDDILAGTSVDTHAWHGPPPDGDI